LNLVVKVRQDALSHEDDLLLAETVLRHIREGSRQLNAFEEVGDALNRTSAACGFRWNAEVRMKYDNAIDLAKRQRKEKKRAAAGKKPPYPLTGQTETSHIQNMNRFEEVSTSSSGKTDLEQDNHNVNHAPLQQTDSLSLDMVIEYLEQLKKDYHTSKQSNQTLEELKVENSSLNERILELENGVMKKEEQLKAIQEEYQVFMQIMDRARQMTVLEDQGTLKSPSFRMDKNGNLQQIAEGSN